MSKILYDKMDDVIEQISQREQTINFLLQVSPEYMIYLIYYKINQIFVFTFRAENISLILLSYLRLLKVFVLRFLKLVSQIV